MDAEQIIRMEQQSNYFVGWMMCVSGSLMVPLALFGGSADKGNVIAGLVVAAMGDVANIIFWFRYRYLGKREGSSILSV